MNFSPRQEARKWPGLGKMVTAVAMLGLVGAVPQSALARRAAGFGLDELFGARPGTYRNVHRPVRTAKVPLPRPRPPEAPPREETEEAKGEPEIPPVTEAPAKPAEKSAAQTPAEPAAPAAPAAPPVPQVSACRQALTEEIAIAPSIPSVHGPGGCGGDDLVRLEAIVLPDKRRVAVTPPATLRCPMASEIADWVRSDIAPLTQKLGSEIATLDNFDSFECRGRNRIKGAPLSEHGKANALDVRAFRLADGRDIGLTDRNQPRSLREDVLHSVCARFVTVLGPDSDWYHEDHIHLDLMERHNNYKICQWDVLDPLPRIAPLMPEERPAEAPPREEAKEEGAKEEAPAAEGDKQEEAKPAAEAAAPEEQPAGKPRRSAKLKK
jgi:hypothetical protein